jgi:ABC-type uncharacterized transport system substrate-binding protein
LDKRNTFTVLLRYAEGRSERLPELAPDLVSLKVDVIVTSTDVAIAALKRETRTIPTVMAFSGDPVGTGFVASLARPVRVEALGAATRIAPPLAGPT